MMDIKTDNGLLSTTVAYWPIFFTGIPKLL